jgi:hypothetical protein
LNAARPLDFQNDFTQDARAELSFFSNSGAWSSM